MKSVTFSPFGSRDADLHWPGPFSASRRRRASGRNLIGLATRSRDGGGAMDARCYPCNRVGQDPGHHVLARERPPSPGYRHHGVAREGEQQRRIDFVPAQEFADHPGISSLLTVRCPVAAPSVANERRTTYPPNE